MKTYVHLWFLAQFFLEWKMSHTKVVKKIKTHILFSVTSFSRKSCLLWDMWQNAVESDRPQMIKCRIRFACCITKATDTHTLRKCNTYCLYTATMVTRTRLNVTLYLHCLSVSTFPHTKVKLINPHWNFRYFLIFKNCDISSLSCVIWLCCSPHFTPCAMQTCGIVKVEEHAFLTSALDSGEWSASRRVRFAFGKRPPGR